MLRQLWVIKHSYDNQLTLLSKPSSTQGKVKQMSMQLLPLLTAHPSLQKSHCCWLPLPHWTYNLVGYETISFRKSNYSVTYNWYYLLLKLSFHIGSWLASVSLLLQDRWSCHTNNKYIIQSIFLWQSLMFSQNAGNFFAKDSETPSQ